jgi:4-amino-4-deoxy-L-arabinose transferase-like glycosyltransferase
MRKSRFISQWTRQDTAATAITLLGLLLRLYRLDGRSFWLDEAMTAHSANLKSPEELFAFVHFWFNSTPAIFVVTWLDRGFGGSEIAIRLPMALAGTLNIFVLYLLGKELMRPFASLVAALALALSPFAVWYSQEARQYAFLMLFTTLQMLFAYRLSLKPTLGVGIAFAAASLLNLYSGYLAIPITAGAFAFCGAMLLARRVVASRRRTGMSNDASPVAPNEPTLAKHVGLLSLSLALTVVGYLPWLSSLLSFFTYGDAAAYHDVPRDIPSLLDAMGFLGLLVVLLAVGIVTAAIYTLRRRWPGGLLLILWIGAGVAPFVLQLGEGTLSLSPRYFACAVPALTLLVGMGVEGLVAGLTRLLATTRRTMQGAPRISGPTLYRAAALLLVVAVVAQLSPALALSYSVPKDDFRGAARLIDTSSPPGSIVLAMHMGDTTFEVESLQYYFNLLHSEVSVVAASKLDLQSASRVVQGHGAVWAADFAPQAAPEYLAAGMKATSFGSFSVVSLDAAGSGMLDQAQRLLQWGETSEPRLHTSLALLDAVAHNSFGDNLLPGAEALAPTGQQPLNPAGVAERWMQPSGAMLVAQLNGFHLTPSGQEVNVTLTTRLLKPGRSYVLLFRYRNWGFTGEHRVFVSAHDAILGWLDTFPDAFGFPCDASTEWIQQGFAFTAPPGTTSAIVWLRANGRDAADFADVELRPLP